MQNVSTTFLTICETIKRNLNEHLLFRNDRQKLTFLEASVRIELENITE